MSTMTREDAFVAVRDLTEAPFTTMSMRRMAESIAGKFSDIITNMPATTHGYSIAYYVGNGMTDECGVPLRWRADQDAMHRKGDPIVESMTGDVICGFCASRHGDAWQGNEVLIAEPLMGEYPHGIMCDHCNEWIAPPEDDPLPLSVSGGDHDADKPRFGVAIWAITDGNSRALIINTVAAENAQHALAMRDRMVNTFAEMDVTGHDGPFVDAVEFSSLDTVEDIMDIEDAAITSVPHFDVHAAFGASLPDVSLFGFETFEDALDEAETLAAGYYGENTHVERIDAAHFRAAPNKDAKGGTVVSIEACDNPECLLDEDGRFRY